MLYDPAFQRFVTVRERSSKEITDYLAGIGVPSEKYEGILEELREKLILDDRRFAENRAYSRRSLNRWGELKIRHELAGLGIDKKDIAEILGNVTEEEWLVSTAREVAKLERSGKTGEELEKAVISRLRSKGYTDKIIYATIKKTGEHE